MVSERQEATAHRRFSAAEKLFALAEMFPQDRKRAAAQAPRPRDRFGRLRARTEQEWRPTLAQQIAAEHGVCTRTVWRWLAGFKSGGFEALRDRPRADRGRSNYLHKRPQWVPIIEERLAAGQTPFKIANDLFRLYGFQAPSHQVVWKFSRHLYRVGPGSLSQGGAESTATL